VRIIGEWLRHIGFVALNVAAATAIAADIDSLWEYADPALSETRFRAAIANTKGDERLELLTQIARTFSLRKRFQDAHRLLDEVERKIKDAGPRPRVRYLLERGRTFNSSAMPDRARPLFTQAWDLARVSQLDGLAVDAAHMTAITFGGTEAAIDWNKMGLALARSSQDAKAKALIPAMLNNSAWDLHDMGRYAQALPLFEEALTEWTVRSRPAQIHFARWSVARCLRSLGRFDEALTRQLALERDDPIDGFVLEEIGELHEALGRPAQARPYFARAAAALAQDEDFARANPARLARLRSKGS
jgi:tetratricopeptide (TPR) repeat protein